MIQQEMLEYQKIDRELFRIEKDLRENVAKITAQIEEYCRAFDEAEDSDELNYIGRKLNEQLDALAAVEKDAKRIQREGEDTVKSLDEINAKLPQVAALCVKFNNEFARVKKSEAKRS